MFGGEVTMYLPVQQHSLVARCATYICISRFTISIFSPFHNVPTPPFYHGYNYKISTHILCIKKMLLRAPCNSCHMFLYKGRFQVSSNCKIAGTISCKKKSDLSNRL